MVNVGQELLNVPFGQMIIQMSTAIAEGQSRLDENGIELAKFLSTTTIKLPGIKAADPEVEISLIGIGFMPSFYQFQESIIEVKMAITMATSSEFKLGVSAKAGWGPFSASVNASYSRKYDYKVEGSSLLRTKLVPVPPPAGLQRYIEAVVNERSKPMQEAIPA